MLAFLLTKLARARSFVPLLPCSRPLRQKRNFPLAPNLFFLNFFCFWTKRREKIFDFSWRSIIDVLPIAIAIPLPSFLPAKFGKQGITATHDRDVDFRIEYGRKWNERLHLSKAFSAIHGNCAAIRSKRDTAAHLDSLKSRCRHKGRSQPVEGSAHYLPRTSQRKIIHAMQPS